MRTVLSKSAQALSSQLHWRSRGMLTYLRAQRAKRALVQCSIVSVGTNAYFGPLYSVCA
jgi:hypothetical protein